MVETLKNEIWRQFGASLDMFENAVIKCPDNLWAYNYSTGKTADAPKDIDELRGCFWYVAYHTLFFTDYYLDMNPENFKMPEPFTQNEEEFDEVLPPKLYSKEELIGYIKHCREKLRLLLRDLDETKAAHRWINPWKDYSMIEITLYNMRHVQHHTGQLNMLLGKIDHNLPVWVSQTKHEL